MRKTTSEALHKYMKQKQLNATKCGSIKESSNGNGSLMRILSIAFYCYKHIDNNDDILEIVRNTSSITHAHEISNMGYYIYVQYVINLLKGQSKEKSYQIIQNLDHSIFQYNTQKTYEWIINKNIFKCKKDEIKSTGYVVSSLEASLWCLLTNNNLKDTILTAVNLGDDTDTIGAI